MSVTDKMVMILRYRGPRCAVRSGVLVAVLCLECALAGAHGLGPFPALSALSNLDESFRLQD